MDVNRCVFNQGLQGIRHMDAIIYIMRYTERSRSLSRSLIQMARCSQIYRHHRISQVIFV